MTFSDRQIELENQMTELGADRARSGVAKAQALGRESLTPAGQQLVRGSMARVVRELEEWMKPAANHVKVEAREMLSSLPVKVTALLALRSCIDGACSGRSYSAVCHDIGRRLDEEYMARWLQKNHKSVWDTARRRAKVIPERAMARLRRDARRVSREKGYRRWSMTHRIRAGMILVETVHRASGIVTLDSERVGKNRTRVVLRLAPETADWIMRSHEAHEFLEPVYLPSVDVPGDWGPDQVGGYATNLVRREYLVKNRSRKTRDLVASAEMPDVYLAVNTLQRVAWEVNPVILETAQALWESGDQTPGMESAEPQPYPEMPNGERTKEWLRARFVIRRENLHRVSRRVEAARILWLAKKLAPEGRLYYPQQLDFRGRTYPIPAFLQPQGPDLARGLLRFADGDYLLRDRPNTAFWIAGANYFGKDKLPLAERVTWAKANEAAIVAVYQDPLVERWWQQASDPWQFLAWTLEAGELLSTGSATTKVPVYIDGTCNGLQILSLLLRDEVGGAATNCVLGPSRRDVYQDVADEVTRRLRERDDDEARAWIAWFPGGRMPRGATKRSVMTVPYGLTPWSSRQYLLDWFEEEIRTGRPSPWGSGPYWLPVGRLADDLWAAIESVVGRAIQGMDWLRSVSDVVVSQGETPVWTAPSGFPVRQAYPNTQTVEVRAKFGERVRVLASRKNVGGLSLRRSRNGIAPNFVHSLDASILARTVAAAAREGLTVVSTIHDSFGARATEVDRLGQLVREEYARTFSEDQLAILRDQLRTLIGNRVELPELPERGTLDPQSAASSTYLFS